MGAAPIAAPLDSSPRPRLHQSETAARWRVDALAPGGYLSMVGMDIEKVSASIAFQDVVTVFHCVVKATPAFP